MRQRSTLHVGRWPWPEYGQSMASRNPFRPGGPMLSLLSKSGQRPHLYCISHHLTMPRHRKKKFAAPESSADTQSIPPVTVVEIIPEAKDPASMITVHPSVYHGGCVDYGSSFSVKETFTNIVCEADYFDLSPEVLHIRTVDSRSRILSATYTGVALFGSRDKFGFCSSGSTFI